MRVTLVPEEPLSFEEFAIKNDLNGENYLCGCIENLQWLEQIVPSVYLRQNEFFRYEFNTAIQGMSLLIFSNKQNIIFTLEFQDAIYVRDYDVTKSSFSEILQINRSDILSFNKKEQLHFMAVKPKKSLKIMNGLRGAPVGGLIPGLIIRGIFSAAAKAEDDSIEKPGCRFILRFQQSGINKELDLIVDEYFVDKFELFLKSHWINESPEPFKLEKEGCFIASACYNDYDHPIVFQLRKFRDEYLIQKNFGRKFIKFYYSHSPKYARIIKNNKNLKSFTKLTLVKPAYYLSKLIMMKKI
jgi:hypothetical protein